MAHYERKPLTASIVEGARLAGPVVVVAFIGGCVSFIAITIYVLSLAAQWPYALALVGIMAATLVVRVLVFDTRSLRAVIAAGLRGLTIYQGGIRLHYRDEVLDVGWDAVRIDTFGHPKYGPHPILVDHTDRPHGLGDLIDADTAIDQIRSHLR